MNERTKVSALFQPDEIRRLSTPSDWAGWRAVLSIWGVIALAFAGAIAFPGPLTFIVAAFVIGGRQLGLAILMHEASHYTLFRTRRLNDLVGNWLGGLFIWIDVERYRTHHHQHHTKTGTDDDTDLSLVTGLPTTRASLARKFLRDLTGLSFLRRVVGLLLMDAGVLKWTVANDAVRLPRRPLGAHLAMLARNLWRVVVANAVLAGVLALTGHAWAYTIWIAAYAIPFSLFVRIRSLAEHACTERTLDMRRNTRTTRAGWLARATVAPLHVNFHIEHHLLPSIPYHKLADAHRLLRERGHVPPPPGYLEVLRVVSSA